MEKCSTKESKYAGANNMQPINGRREFSYVIAPLTSLLKGYESSQSLFLHCYLLLWPCQSPGITQFFKNYSYWFLSFSCPSWRNITQEVFLWLVWALLFLRLFILLSHSFLIIPERPALKPEKEILTLLVFKRSTTAVKNIHCGFLNLVERKHTQSSYALCRNSTHGPLRESLFGK